jgi:hypothetical protein
MNLYVRTIFEHPTIRSLAQAIEQTGTEPVDGTHREIVQVPRVAANR